MMNALTLDEPAARLAAVDWKEAEAALARSGYAVLPGLFAARDCRAVAALFDEEALFRKHVVMARHGYGQGDYKSFGYPLPGPLASLRASFYERFLPTARAWSARLGVGAAYPETHEVFLKTCHEAGQKRPTCLLLRYREGDYNRLH
jgi:hypothetical protein